MVEPIEIYGRASPNIAWPVFEPAQPFPLGTHAAQLSPVPIYLSPPPHAALSTPLSPCPCHLRADTEHDPLITRYDA